MEKIWLKSYQKGVPAEINPDRYHSINEMFEEACEHFAEKNAFVNMGSFLKFRDLDEKTKAFAAYLQEKLKLKKGDRIALMMPNLLQYPIALYGALRAGLIVVNINPLYTARELEFQLQDSGTKTIVVVENFAHTVEKVLTSVQLSHVITTEIGDCFPFFKSKLVNFVVKYVKKMVPTWKIPGSISFREVLEQGKKLRFQKQNLKGDDIAFLQYTGGTTGIVKGAVLTHRNMVANMEQALAWVGPVIHPGNEIIITALPMYHIFSLTANCLTFMKLGALNVLITNPRDIKGFIKELGKYPFTAITGVNTLFNALLHDENFKKVNFSSLRLTLGGGMAVQRAVAEKWKKITQNPLLEAYGLTETSPAACINPMNLKDFNSSVGLPIPSTNISIRDDDGNELSINQSGELWIKGPQVMKEYWNRPEETKNVLKDGWLRTGDVTTIDEQGFVRIVDRKKDMILVSGFNVYPNEVEDVIALMPGIKEVAVIGIPDESGERVKAFIVRNNGGDLTKEKIIDFCRTALTAYKVPKEVEFRKELPKTNVGKILRRALREEIA